MKIMSEKQNDSKILLMIVEDEVDIGEQILKLIDMHFKEIKAQYVKSSREAIEIWKNNNHCKIHASLTTKQITTSNSSSRYIQSSSNPTIRRTCK